MVTPRQVASLALATAGAALTTFTMAAEIERKRHLFLDPALITEKSDVELRTNPASRRETVIFPDQPWEKHIISFFLTVREEGGKLRMWYICRDDWGEGSQANLAYAESRDGIRWEKPNLGLYDYKGSRANNLLGVHSLEGVVFQDPNMPPEQRYVYVTADKPQMGKNSAGPTGIYRYYSADGLRWQRDAEPVLQAGSDTQNVVWGDERLKEYVVILRGWNPNPNRRKVVRLTTKSLTTPMAIKPTRRGVGNYFYDEIPTILVCDDQDPSRTDIYNMSAQPYPLDPTWYVGFPTFLRRSAETDAPGWRGRHMGPAEIQFVGSPDSRAWHRYDRAAYAPPSIASPHKKNMTFMGTGLVVRGNELWSYGTEFESVHGDVEARKRKTDGFIVRYVQRIDGFVSLDTREREGFARTTPVKVNGTRLLLNVDTGALGELRVGVLDTSGKPIPGFEIARCDYVESNHPAAAVSWGGSADMSALRGRDVRLEFRSTRTKLYSFRFE